MNVNQYQPIRTRLALYCHIYILASSKKNRFGFGQLSFFTM